MTGHNFYSNTSNPTFLDRLKEGLRKCKRFDFSVSFIKRAGLDLFYDDLLACLRRGAKGRILTSTYQNFTDCHSLSRFLDLKRDFPKSFDCHLDDGCFGKDGFHTKGYLFEMEDGSHEVIVGSSNITRFALLFNKEWDISVITNQNDAFLRKVENEFEDLYSKTLPLSQSLIDSYRDRLQYSIYSWDMDYDDPSKISLIKPNLMQAKALAELRRQRSMGHNKALVIAATGSGKTFLSAFDAMGFDAKRLLFIAHKDTILQASLETFQKVFRTSRSYALFLGSQNKHAEEADFIFASNQMLNLHLREFDPKQFDYIVIDEVHHGAASTYQNIISYFQPEFLLGLTATPERMDGKSIYDIFENNVPFDLRLREAIENDLVVPFHYYGIKDSLLSYSEDEIKNQIGNIAKQMCSDENCRFIDEQIQKYKKTDEKLRCIGFCSTRNEAQSLADSFAMLGYHTAYLDGHNSTGERIDVFRRLESTEDPLNLVFVIDILNEGVDIPSINMVLFLRPTESSTIFIQQLGRGLRKYPGKPYVTVLDFIANSYQRSSQIAAALGSLSKSGTVDQASLLCSIRENFSSLDLPGVIIRFDEESQEEIISSIESTNFNNYGRLKSDYAKFKDCLVKEKEMSERDYIKPTLFLNSAYGVDFLRFAKYGDCYYEFLQKADQENIPGFSKEEISVLKYINFFLPLVREEEYQILKALAKGPLTVSELREGLKGTMSFCEERFAHSLTVLSGNVAVNTTGTKKLIKLENDTVSLSFSINNAPFKEYLLDALDYGIEKFESEFSLDLDAETPEKPIFLHRFGSYSEPQSFLGLCVYTKDFSQANLMPMSGIHYTNKGLAIYITLNKDKSLEERLNYKDKFLSTRLMQWESSTSTTLENAKGEKLIQTKRVMVFVRKTKKNWGRITPYIYAGMGSLENPRVSDNKAKSLLFDLILDNPIPKAYCYDLGIEDTEYGKA